MSGLIGKTVKAEVWLPDSTSSLIERKTCWEQALHGLSVKILQTNLIRGTSVFLSMCQSRQFSFKRFTGIRLAPQNKVKFTSFMQHLQVITGSELWYLSAVWCLQVQAWAPILSFLRARWTLCSPSSPAKGRGSAPATRSWKLWVTISH